ncbi:MAG: 3-hydroxy-3-methylglutaryl CoA synthase [Chloroflexi bacterium]|nr:3-hydroxy-3-methylglutaryl CoA synthase [Chloroflexota bacterium]
MAGITEFGAYVPIHRLGPGTEGWTATAERAVANFDEDSITMAVAAVGDCLKGMDRTAIDGLYLASTTVPYEEKQGSTLVAVASDLSDNIFTSDVGHSLRSGTLALTMALDAASSGRVRNCVVVASDSRLGPPGSAFEKTSGDGAAAIVVGSGGELAVLEATVSVSNEIMDVWRPSGDTTVRSWEERFVQQEGYLDSVQKVVEQLAKKTGRTLDSFDRIVLFAPDARRHAEAVKLLGIARPKLQDPLFDRLGNTGAAFALMQLVAALEQASPGESILVINYGDGADALVFRTTAALAERRRDRNRGMRGHLESKLTIPAYSEYLRWRGLLSEDSGVRRPNLSGPSAAALHREQDQVLRFYAVRCHQCGTVMYPPQRICVDCRARDQFDSVRLVGEPAKLFTYSMDYIAGTVDVPLVLTIVDWENGARAVLMMTDRDTERIAVEMPVEVTFRLARSGGGIKNYYWKAAPLRELFVAEPAGV